MTDPALAAAALAGLTPICLALPESGELPFGVHRRFVVRGKTFAWFNDDHHGDGMTMLVTKAEPGLAETLIADEPGRFLRPAYLGHKGWVGLRLDVGPIDWDKVRGLVTDSYLLIAPKRLAALVVDLPHRASWRPDPALDGANGRP